MTSIIYAIGDVHGRDDLLGQLHEYIVDHHRLLYPERPGKIIHLGDYVDGGRSGFKVINRLMAGVEGFDSVCLIGNHEAMMLDCLKTDDQQVWHTWLSNGGETTLRELGVSFRFGGYDPLKLKEAIGEERIAWLRSRPLFHQEGRYLFVHAGIAPGVPLESQQPKDLLWIRSRFLDCEDEHGFVVVHGHTPGDEPVVKPNRICVDVGATSNGQLAAAVLDGANPPHFLRADG